MLKWIEYICIVEIKQQIRIAESVFMVAFIESSFINGRKSINFLLFCKDFVENITMR